MGKIYSLHDAIAKYVSDGDFIAFGGFTTNRKPFAAVHEILRQGKKDFIVQTGPAGHDVDMLIGEGRVKAFINCYIANSGFTNVCRRFRKAYEQGKLLMEDYSQDVLMLQLHAASLGLPFLPVKLMIGSGLETEWGITKEQRQKIDKLPDDKFVTIENPFKKGDKVLACPVPEIDTAIIHVQYASPAVSLVMNSMMLILQLQLRRPSLPASRSSAMNRFVAIRPSTPFRASAWMLLYWLLLVHIRLSATAFTIMIRLITRLMMSPARLKRTLRHLWMNGSTVLKTMRNTSTNLVLPVLQSCRSFRASVML